ncbi:MAG: Eco57I restriction-modification methylase domain-containing protein [Thiolinea sp.]
MKRKNTLSLSFDTLRLEGGLLLPDILERAAQGKLNSQQATDYQIPKGLKLQDEYSRSFQIARAQWKAFSAQLERKDLDAQAVTQQFVLELLRDALGYRELDVQAEGITLEERHYPIPLLAFGRVPIVIAPHTLGLDEAAECFAIVGGGSRKKSAFQLTQEFLNASEGCLWGIVSNGRQLRLLRDAATLTRPSFLEFELATILDDERYPDFAALWRLLHGSLAGKTGAVSEDCHWERWRNEGLQEGTRVREGLRKGVEEALLTLGQGFLENPANEQLRLDLLEGRLRTQDYYQQLLRLVYRLIFLFTVEERGLLQPEVKDVTAEQLAARKAYTDGYSQSRLRSRCMRRRAYDAHHDLWDATRVVFRGLARGEALLDLPALGGLFAEQQCVALDAATLSNAALLTAVKHLRWSNRSGQLAPVDYANMASEEMGSVYEGLLELVPEVDVHARRFDFVGRTLAGSTQGNARKLSGSYYTPDSLVQELIKSALEPVIKQRLEANKAYPVAAILSIKVIDPACGSGHFLLAAANRLAQELAECQAQDGVVTPQAYRHALREVISHCIYGVDKNPLAIELARTALWLVGYEAGKPLSFIDHHIRCGDALLGVLDPVILEKGIPDKAYDALTGDDKEVVKALKAENKKWLKQFQDFAQKDMFNKSMRVEAFGKLDDLPDGDLGEVESKQQTWRTERQHIRASLPQQMADMYVAAFLMPKVRDYQAQMPMSGYFWHVYQGHEPLGKTPDIIDAFCQQAQVFHWWLEFPHIHAQGGFDVVLGNPPWERIKLQEQEFFANRSPLIAEAQNKAEREQRIQWLKDGMLSHHLRGGQGDPSVLERGLYREFLVARRGAEAASVFAHDSGRYPLTGVGDVNTYALFAETISQLLMPHGRAGFIVPTGIATDDSTKDYFAHIAQSGRLVSFYDFENRNIFPSVHKSYKFSLLTLGQVSVSEFVCFATEVGQLTDPRRRFRLTPEEFRLINPNTKTCPVFRSQMDAELTKKLYRAAPVLIEEGESENKNPWGIRIRRIFDMAKADVVGTCVNLEAEGFIPMMEAKMFHQFDHCWATYYFNENGELDSRDCDVSEKSNPLYSSTPRYWVDEREVLARIADVPTKVARAWLSNDLDAMELECARWLAGELMRHETDAGLASLKATQHAEAALKNHYRWAYSVLAAENETGKKANTLWSKWAKTNEGIVLTEQDLSSLQCARSQAEVRMLLNNWMDNRSPRWLIGWRDICRSTDERTVIASVMPRSGTDFTIRTNLYSKKCISSLHYACFLANFNSLTFDFATRQKIGGTHLADFITKQLPVLLHDGYTSADLDFIVPRVLELTYTAHDLKDWAADLGYHGAPFAWDEERRAEIRAELDAYYARLYGLERDELRYILDPAEVMGEDYPSETFRVLKNREMKVFGEYRTQRLVLDAWDRLEKES